MKIIFLIIVFFTIIGCVSNIQVDEAKVMADNLLNNISSGKAEKSFSKKYFSQEQTKIVLNSLRYDCDFANRKGNYINDYIHKEQGLTSVSFIYEFFLKCDSVRLILTYKLESKIELYEFKIEPIETKNKMIIKRENQLKY